MKSEHLINRIAILATLFAMDTFGGSVAFSQSIRYSGEFTNKTRGSSGEVVIEIVFHKDNTVTGNINFTEYPNQETLCGAGEFSGTRTGLVVNFSFVSNDPDPGCYFDAGWRFSVKATLSHDEKFMTGIYGIGDYDSQQGVFSVSYHPPPDTLPKTLKNILLDPTTEIISEHENGEKVWRKLVIRDSTVVGIFTIAPPEGKLSVEAFKIDYSPLHYYPLAIDSLEVKFTMEDDAGNGRNITNFMDFQVSQNDGVQPIFTPSVKNIRLGEQFRFSLTDSLHWKIPFRYLKRREPFVATIVVEDMSPSLDRASVISKSSFNLEFRATTSIFETIVMRLLGSISEIIVGILSAVLTFLITRKFMSKQQEDQNEG